MPGNYPPLLSRILRGQEYLSLLGSPEVERHRSDWRELFRALGSMPPHDADIAARFHTQWHVCHHFIRELVDDDELLLDTLWVWLPRYQGPAVELYRGENLDRLAAGRIGFGWSDKMETARMFASGLNAVGSGGVILRTSAPSNAVIAGPTDHSANWLGESEFTVDRRRLVEVVQVQRFAPA